jgi:hypothetical protein
MDPGPLANATRVRRFHEAADRLALCDAIEAEAVRLRPRLGAVGVQMVEAGREARPGAVALMAAAMGGEFAVMA